LWKKARERGAEEGLATGLEPTPPSRMRRSIQNRTEHTRISWCNHWFAAPIAKTRLRKLSRNSPLTALFKSTAKESGLHACNATSRDCEQAWTRDAPPENAKSIGRRPQTPVHGRCPKSRDRQGREMRHLKMSSPLDGAHKHQSRTVSKVERLRTGKDARCAT
jgi:hypothetical protein